MGQMVQEVAIKQCFSLLLQANGGIQLGLGLAWQQRGQKMHVRRRRFHIDQKLRPGETEQCAQVVAVQKSIEPDLAGRSEEHKAEHRSLMRISYAVFCLKKKI